MIVGEDAVVDPHPGIGEGEHRSIAIGQFLVEETEVVAEVSQTEAFAGHRLKLFQVARAVRGPIEDQGSPGGPGDEGTPLPERRLLGLEQYRPRLLPAGGKDLRGIAGQIQKLTLSHHPR
jgi:hypothetical protein